MTPQYTNLLQIRDKWRPVLLVDETGLRQSATSHCQVLVLLVDETGIRQSAANHRQVAVIFFGR